MSNEPTVDIDKFLGIYNREQSRRLPIGALTTAENVDIDGQMENTSKSSVNDRNMVV
jgi:hypothetical protein